MCSEDMILKCIEGLHECIYLFGRGEANKITYDIAYKSLRTIARELDREDEYAIWATKFDADQFRLAAKIARLNNEARAKRKAALWEAANPESHYLKDYSDSTSESEVVSND